MFKDQAFALRQEVAEEVFVRLQKDRARVSAKLGPLLAYLETHLFDNDLRVGTWMRRCGIRDKSLSSHFTHQLGRSPWEYVTHHRLEVAATLLVTSELRPWRIGTVVGYSGTSSFGRAFKLWAGCSPTAYRERGGAIRAPEVNPKLLVDPEELERAMEGFLAPERAERLHRRLSSLAGQLEVAYPKLGASRAVVKPVVGAEFFEVTLAEQLWRRLRTRPFEEQMELVKSQIAFNTPALFELLLRKSREEGRKNRQRGVEIAKLALESLEAIGGLGNQLPNYRVRGWAWIGKAHRLAYELLDAERAFTAAEDEWDTIPSGFRDELAVAELWHFKAVLRTCQRRLDEALSLTAAAIPILKLRSNSQSQLVKTLLAQGTILFYKEEHQAALEVLREAGELAAQYSDPYIRLAIQANTANANVGAGLLDEARTNLEKARPLCLEVGSRLIGLQLDWIEGLLEEENGCPHNAQRKLSKSRDGFSELGELGYYAVVSLDLAILCVKLGEVDRPLILAAEVATVFETLGAHDELLVALKLLQAGSATHRISRALLQEARQLVEKLRPLGFGNLKCLKTGTERIYDHRDPLDTQ